MNASEFNEQLKDLTDNFREQVASLVMQARADTEDGEFGKDPVTWVDNPNWERTVDGIAELAGWTHDRLNGRTRLDRRSMTKKIRRALGYTYP